GFGRTRWNLFSGFPAVDLGPPVNKPPAIGVVLPKFFLDLKKCAGVAYSSFNLHPVADDFRIRQKFTNLRLRVPRDFLGVEFVESAAVTIAFFQHERPVQSGLDA